MPYTNIFLSYIGLLMLAAGVSAGIMTMAMGVRSLDEMSAVYEKHGISSNVQNHQENFDYFTSFTF